MIKDLDLMKDITPLFEKQIVVWGIGRKGRLLLEDIKTMEAGRKGIYLCDSNNMLWGERICDEKVLSPSELKDALNKAVLKDIIFLVPAESLSAQDEIIERIESEYGTSIDVYTNYAIEWGIYLCINSPYLASRFRERKLEEHRIKKMMHSEAMPAKINALTYFSFCPLHNDEIILIYQPGKVASSSIYQSIQNYNRYVLHTHVLTGIGSDKDDLYNLVNLKSGKIISLVRDPIERQISAMWQNVVNINRYSDEVDFSEIENFYFYDGFENEEFEWFNEQIKEVFHIDVYDYPFDSQKGYTIIEAGKIQILLMKMEKVNELVNVIGNFLGIEQFQLQTSNVSGQKAYRFALKAYKENFVLSPSRLHDIYEKNTYVQHFYSKQERENLYKKWAKTPEV